MKIGIIGSRSRNTLDDKFKVLQAFKLYYVHGDTIISGGCPRGGDRFAEEIAAELNIPITIHKAEWDKYGKSAGFQRNTLIAIDSDMLIACVSPDRKGGTEDTIRKFNNKGRIILV